MPLSTYLRAPLVHKGRFVHPEDGWQLDIDESRINGLIDNFNRMKANGVRVPLTKVHNFHDDPDNTLGYLEGLYVDKDGWLAGEFQLRGEDSLKLAQKVDQVSIGIHKDFYDGMQNSYGMVVQHVAITPTPVVPGQGGFKIAASMDSKQYIVLNEGDTSMLNKDELTRLSEILGVEVSVEDALDRIEAKVKGVSPEVKEKLEASLKRVQELEELTVPKIDRDTIEERAEFYGECMDSLSAKFSSKCIDGLKGLLIGAPDSRNVYAMSTNGGRDIALVKAVYQLLRNEPDRISLGERTGSQSGTVALDSKGRDGSDGLNLKIHNKMRGYASLETLEA